MPTKEPSIDEIGFDDEVEIEILRRDLKTAKGLLEELWGEIRGLDKTIRGRSLHKRIADFLCPPIDEGTR